MFRDSPMCSDNMNKQIDKLGFIENDSNILFLQVPWPDHFSFIG